MDLIKRKKIVGTMIVRQKDNMNGQTKTVNIETMTTEELAILGFQQCQMLMQAKDSIFAITQEVEKRHQRQEAMKKELNNNDGKH